MGCFIGRLRAIEDEPEEYTEIVALSCTSDSDAECAPPLLQPTCVHKADKHRLDSFAIKSPSSAKLPTSASAPRILYRYTV